MALTPLIEKQPWDIVNTCKTQGDLIMQRLEWEYVQEFLRGNHFVYLDYKGRQVIQLTDGVRIPGTNFRVSGLINAPIDPHIITIANSIGSKVYANFPYLVPQVVAATSEDADRDAAEDTTMLLRYYRRSLDEEEMYNQIIGYLKPCGNVFIKTYWDKNAGDYGAMDERGVPMKIGDIAAVVNAPTKMLLPKGIAHDNALPWIGEQNALPVEEIYDRWGVDVEPEGNLEDINTLKAMDYSNNRWVNKIEGHARVYEIYMRPTKSYPLGRLVICCNKKTLYDGVWDEKLTSQYPDEWNPYTHIGWMKIEGDYWYKSLLFYLTDHQIQLNKLYKMLAQSKRYPRGYWIYRKTGSVDWKQVNWDAENATPRIPYEAEAPQFVPSITQNMDIPGEMAGIRQQMDNIAANYEISRGNNIPGITSGKQVDMLQSANTQQNSPLLGGIAKAFTGGHWKKVIRLAAVHYESIGRMLQIVGENNESIAKRFTPDQITSDDVILAYGPCFLLDPVSREQELNQMFQNGFFGPPNDPMAIKRYSKLRGIGGGLEDAYAEITADENMADLENDNFINGQLEETDPILIQQFKAKPFGQDWEQYSQVMQQYQQQAQKYQTIKQTYETGQIPPEIAAQISPDMIEQLNPGQQPPEPKIYRLARPYEDHPYHLKILNKLRKTHKFEAVCQQNPELRKATDFHDLSHQQYIAANSPPPPPSQMDIQKSKNVTQIVGDLINAYSKNGPNLAMDQALSGMTVNQLMDILSGKPPQQSPPMQGG